MFQGSKIVILIKFFFLVSTVVAGCLLHLAGFGAIPLMFILFFAIAAISCFIYAPKQVLYASFHNILLVVVNVVAIMFKKYQEGSDISRDLFVMFTILIFFSLAGCAVAQTGRGYAVKERRGFEVIQKDEDLN